MWIILVLTVSYACGYPLQISPSPLAVFEENSNLTLTCEYNGTLVPLEILWYSYNAESIRLNASCIPSYGMSSQNKTFTCNESIGKFQMTIINAHRERNGEVWECELLLSDNTYMYSNWTMLNVRENRTETSCFKNYDAEICPFPIARVKENETLVIAVKINVTRVWNYIWSSEYINRYTHIHGFYTENNCTNQEISGIKPAGYNVTCNPSEAILTFTWNQIQRDRNAHMFSIDLTLDARPSIYKFIFFSVRGTDATAPNTTNPASTTIATSSSSTSSTASTSMVPTTKLPPSYVPDPGEYELQLEFDLKVEIGYNETYADKTSPEFQSLATKFIVSLTEVFKSLKGFKSIDIVRLRRGSVIVDYSVNVFGTVDVATVTEEIKSKIVYNLTSIAGVPVNTAYTLESMTRRLETLRTKDKCSLASANLCPFGYYCKPSIASTSVILCIDRCNSSVCKNNGECYVGHHSHDVQCRCAFSENIVYTGQRCETKTRVVTVQERNLYLIIACSIVCGILLVFISTVCVINRKRNRLKKRLTISHVLRLDEMHKRSDNDVPAMDEQLYVINLNPALIRHPEGYFDGRGDFRHQDHGLDGGYMQVQDTDYDYIHPHLEI